MWSTLTIDLVFSRFFDENHLTQILIALRIYSSAPNMPHVSSQLMRFATVRQVTHHIHSTRTRKTRASHICRVRAPVDGDMFICKCRPKTHEQRGPRVPSAHLLKPTIRYTLATAFVSPTLRCCDDVRAQQFSVCQRVCSSVTCDDRISFHTWTQQKSCARVHRGKRFKRWVPQLSDSTHENATPQLPFTAVGCVFACSR